MNLRPFGYIAMGGLLGLIGVGFWKSSHRPPQSAPLPPATESVEALSSASDSSQDFAMATASPAPSVEQPLAATRPVRPSPEALRDMDGIQLMLRDFRTRLGSNPVGTNAEIMKDVMGGNRVQARLGPPEGQSVNEQGELVDRWGAPYFFHQLSKDEMEIRSSGPDRAMWTTDDIVVR